MKIMYIFDKEKANCILFKDYLFSPQYFIRRVSFV